MNIWWFMRILVQIIQLLTSNSLNRMEWVEYMPNYCNAYEIIKCLNCFRTSDPVYCISDVQKQKIIPHLSMLPTCMSDFYRTVQFTEAEMGPEQPRPLHCCNQSKCWPLSIWIVRGIWSREDQALPPSTTGSWPTRSGCASLTPACGRWITGQYRSRRCHSPSKKIPSTRPETYCSIWY